jgi:hypothetical protein
MLTRVDGSMDGIGMAMNWFEIKEEEIVSMSCISSHHPSIQA